MPNRSITNNTRAEIMPLTAEAENPRGVSSTVLVGETMILDKVSEETGISSVLNESFGGSDGRKLSHRLTTKYAVEKL